MLKKGHDSSTLFIQTNKFEYRDKKLRLKIN